ncbi:hypothetical protein NBRC10512_001094 [Rhodotorula toruloides]|uniref:RHTO0S06e11276g1_1 n=2 Tax=Rhodotorula toruloides TaxID=5286 RepID=A0A061B5D7_RHOTO|nr:uncharacterized protein RHTO_04385 [Rhodotorula toruloides NP11]EMS19384.1 hypothetical protein RHTO_04385 [Rhodotorula toruloides NP11]KAJ8293599.1 hypothetical protein OF846_003598 [Rhodotorula toruloides]CDR42233.1 RHTO0S06e11276g1_1 [Rhodotorula toruloides]
MAAVFTHVPRVSWTTTDLSELDIEDMLETWDETVTDYIASYAGEGVSSPVSPTFSSATSSPRLPRTSSLLQLQPTTLPPMQPAISSHCLGIDTERRPSDASLLSPSSLAFDAFRFPSSSDSLSPPTPSSPAGLFPSDSPPLDRKTEDMLDLDEFFGTPRASPFPTFGPRTNARPDTSGAIRAFAKRLEANLPPPPVPPSRRVSVAPSTSTGSSVSSGRTATSKATAVYPKPAKKEKDKVQTKAYPRPRQKNEAEDEIVKALRANWLMLR